MSNPTSRRITTILLLATLAAATACTTSSPPDPGRVSGPYIGGGVGGSPG